MKIIQNPKLFRCIMIQYTHLIFLIVYQFTLNNQLVWTSEKNCYFPSFIHHSPESIWMTDYSVDNLHQSMHNSHSNKYLHKTSLIYSIDLPKELYNYKLNFLNLQYGWLQMLFTKDSNHAWLFLSCYHILCTKHSIYFTSLLKYFTNICIINEYTTYRNDNNSSYKSNIQWYNTTYNQCMNYTIMKNNVNNNNNNNDNSRSNDQSLLGYVKMSCSWQLDRNIYLVQYTNSYGGSIYQCLKFEPINELESVSVFNLYLSEYTSTTADSTLCHPRAFKHDPSKWIATLPSNAESSTPLCPISGGFQVNQILDLRNNEILCEPNVYATLESECMAGEGILWTFQQPHCNPFVQNYKTQFQCHSTWRSHQLNYILVYRQINQHTYEFYQLVYIQLPVELSTESKIYGRFSPIWIIHGLQTDKTTEQIIISRSYAFNSIERYSSKSKNFILQNTSIKIYEVQIRRAFGNCDDERVSCIHGCEYNARNQFFCHRSCLIPGQTCGNTNYDSCKFHTNYHGIWDLIEPILIHDTITTYEHLSSRLIAQFFIKNNTLIISSINDLFYTMNLYCVKEIQESFYDRYILRSDYQINGCHSRYLCLEVYRGNKNDFESSSSVNSILYRISVGGKHLLTDVCQFNTDNQLYGHIIYPLRANILIRNTADNNALNPPGVTKCGLYQLRLTGTLYILSPELTQFGSQINLFNKTSKQVVDNHSNITTYINTKLFNSNDNDDVIVVNGDKSYQGPCFIEISDFNSNLGITGEFDNILRIRHHCESTIYPSIFKSDHQCIASFNIDGISTISTSYLLLITYLKITDQYYCLIIQTNRDDTMKSNYTIFMYHSPQCQYKTTPFENIKLDESKAFAKLILTSDRQNDNSTKLLKKNLQKFTIFTQHHHSQQQQHQQTNTTR
ncbi:hypothetical protein EWB00_002776, partial [Schistosoma japonicum]